MSKPTVINHSPGQVAGSRQPGPVHLPLGSVFTPSIRIQKSERTKPQRPEPPPYFFKKHLLGKLLRKKKKKTLSLFPFGAIVVAFGPSQGENSGVILHFFLSHQFIRTSHQLYLQSPSQVCVSLRLTAAALAKVTNIYPTSLCLHPTPTIKSATNSHTKL